MDKILISNIGNRNITYKGKVFPELATEERKIIFDRITDKENPGALSFRDFTRFLLDNWDAEKEYVKINILGDLMKPMRSEIREVVLFVTNSVGQEKNDQDTLFEGEVLKRLIEYEYRIPVQVQQLQCKVTDNNKLLERYKWKIKNLLRSRSESRFVVCDAGGTAQQKSSLKIILEFLLKEDRYEVYYVNPNGEIEQTPPVEYRKIIIDEQCRSLVEASEYDAAINLKGFHPHRINTWEKPPVDVQLMTVGFYRKNRYWEGLSHYIQDNLQKSIVKNTPWLALLAQQHSILAPEEELGIQAPDQIFRVGEDLALTRLYFNLSDYSSAILSFSIFYERYLTAIISEVLKYDLVREYQTESARLKAEAKGLFANISEKYKDEIYISVPFLIDIARNVDLKSNQMLLDLIDPYISRGRKVSGNTLHINTARNSIAHEGKLIGETRIKTKMNYFPTLLENTYRLFGLPDQCPYGVLNNLIMDNQ